MICLIKKKKNTGNAKLQIWTLVIPCILPEAGLVDDWTHSKSVLKFNCEHVISSYVRHNLHLRRSYRCKIHEKLKLLLQFPQSPFEKMRHMLSNTVMWSELFNGKKKKKKKKSLNLSKYSSCFLGFVSVFYFISSRHSKQIDKYMSNKSQSQT